MRTQQFFQKKLKFIVDNGGESPPPSSIIPTNAKKEYP